MIAHDLTARLTITTTNRIAITKATINTTKTINTGRGEFAPSQIWMGKFRCGKFRGASQQDTVTGVCKFYCRRQCTSKRG